MAVSKKQVFATLKSTADLMQVIDTKLQRVTISKPQPWLAATLLHMTI
jgi:hypothetical protein